MYMCPVYSIRITVCLSETELESEATLSSYRWRPEYDLLQFKLVCIMIFELEIPKYI